MVMAEETLINAERDLGLDNHLVAQLRLRLEK
jgi:hypothetical protein